MQCPKCGNSKFKVTSSVHNNGKGRNHLKKKVNDLLDWYGCDFVARIRKCQLCNFSSITVEIEIKDLKEVAKHKN